MHCVDNKYKYVFVVVIQQHNVLSLYALDTRLISISTQVALANN